MTDFLASRQNPVSTQRPEDLNRRLGAIDRYFGSSWLAQKGDHPLQLLWERSDPLATVELLNFGNALLKLDKIDDKWTAEQVAKIKDGDIGQRQGAIFEILALSLFPDGQCEIIPAAESQPGYDATLKLLDGTPVLVSLKNHGISSYEEYFKEQAAKTDETFQNSLKKIARTGIEIRVLSPVSLNSEAEWTNLRSDIEKCVDAIVTKSDVALTGNWSIVTKSLNGHDPLSPRYLTSSCFIASLIHKSEQNKFIDDIRKGFDNLVKQTKDLDKDICRVVFLRLSQTASIPKCAEWARWYFSEYPSDPISMIILYQTSVTTTANGQHSEVSHFIIPVVGPHYAKWSNQGTGRTRRLPGFSVYVGGIATEPTQNILTDGSVEINMNDFYVYQRADVYQLVQVVEGAELNLSNPATGVLIHADLEKNGKSVGLVSTRSHRYKELLMLP